MPYFSELVSDDDHWTIPNFDHGALLTVTGGASNNNCTTVRNTLINHACRSPTVGVFMLNGDPEYVYVGYHPTLYPADFANVSPLDDLATVLVGDNLETAETVTFPNTSFTRTNEILAYNRDYITGNNGHAHGPPVFRFDAPNAGTADTNQLRTRPFLTLSRNMADAVLQMAGNHGRVPLLAFYTNVILPEINHADNARQLAVVPLSDWYRCAIINAAGGTESVLAVTPTEVNTLQNRRALNTFKAEVIKPLLAKLGWGGPGLTTASFQQGVQAIQNTLTNTTNNTIDYQRQKDNKTFTAKHGTALAERIQRLTDANDDASLPEVHRLVAASGKHQAHGIIASLVQARAIASEVPLTASNWPIISPKLVDTLFRHYQPYATGQVFAEGFSPFAMLCEGHSERDLVVKRINQAVQAEQGASLSLGDAAELTTSDVRFPTSPQQTAEKFYAWSVLADVWFGANHDVARAIRRAVLELGPGLHRIYDAHLDNPRHGMDLVNRVAYDCQQDFFSYLNAKTHDGSTVAPTFQNAIDKVTSFRADSLSTLPNSWYALMDIPARPAGSGTQQEGTGGTPTLREAAGVIGGRNAHADAGLTGRFANSGHSSLKALMEGHTVTVPKQGGKDVCLAWALKGSCSRQCRRADMHTRYTTATVRKLNQLLTDCGVPPTQD